MAGLRHRQHRLMNRDRHTYRYEKCRHARLPHPGGSCQTPGTQQPSAAATPDPRHYVQHGISGISASLLATGVTMGNRTVPDSCEIGAFNEEGRLLVPARYSAVLRHLRYGVAIPIQSALQAVPQWSR